MGGRIWWYIVLGDGHAFVGSELFWGPERVAVMIMVWVCPWEGDGYQWLASFGLLE